MRKLKRPSQEITDDKLKQLETRVEDIIDLAEELASEEEIGDYVLVVNYTDQLGDVFFHDTRSSSVLKDGVNT